MEGFVVLDYSERWRAAPADLTRWIEAARLEVLEEIIEGVDAAQALVDVLSGRNVGKVVIRLGPRSAVGALIGRRRRSQPEELGGVLTADASLSLLFQRQFLEFFEATRQRKAVAAEHDLVAKLTIHRSHQLRIERLGKIR
jgi:hypothetical protein